jgi:hypothetical protein
MNRARKRVRRAERRAEFVEAFSVALDAYYEMEGRSVGGSVHVIFDDGNVSQEVADWCAERAEEWSRDWGDPPFPEDVTIAKWAALLTTDERRAVYEGSFSDDYDATGGIPILGFAYFEA